MKVGQRVIYTKAGNDHIRGMDEYIGKVFTIASITETGLWVRFKEDDGRFRFDTSVIVSELAKVR